MGNYLINGPGGLEKKFQDMSEKPAAQHADLGTGEPSGEAMIGRSTLRKVARNRRGCTGSQSSH